MNCIYYDYRFENNTIVFESVKETYKFKLDEICKVQIFPGIGVVRSISATRIYGEKNKIAIGPKSVDDYESLVRQIHVLLRNKKKIKYVKGCYVLRLFMISMLPFWLGLAYYIILSQRYNFRNGIPFSFHYLYGIVPTVVVLFNYPKNFKDTKVETYDPEIVIRFGPRIFYDRSYLEKVVREEDLS